ncbi:MAG: hypothetical protein V1492_01910 [Candidatus Micrarchaeota archaeon]
MNINLKLSGFAEHVINEMIRKGYAANKTEAIRITVLDYKHHHLDREDDKMTNEDIKDLKKAIKEYKAGKVVSLRDGP